tara:strand:+ start:704 stop:931 length:228 start_codon:yes stop_codon:yes gene_type:complete
VTVERKTGENSLIHDAYQSSLRIDAYYFRIFPTVIYTIDPIAKVHNLLTIKIRKTDLTAPVANITGDENNGSPPH